MNFDSILAGVTFYQSAVGVVLIFGALAGIEVVIRGGRFLLDAIGNDADDEDDEDDAFDDETDDDESSERN